MANGLSVPADLSMLSGVAAELASAFVSLSGDIALVVDDGGVIRSVAFGDGGPGPQASSWIGRPWVETVTGDTRRKIELLLQEADAPGVTTQRREVNHPSSSGPDIPVAYAALRLSARGPVIAVGRDLRAIAAIQQRMIDTQHEMERDYWRLRQAQARHRLLGQVAADAVMIIDGESGRPLQSNPAALALFGAVDASLPVPLMELVALVERTGRAAEVRTRLAGDALPPWIELTAMPFRTAGDGPPASRLLVRARATETEVLPPLGQSVAITDMRGHLVMSSPAFAGLCRGIDPAQADGRPLVELLGDPQRHLAALLVDVRRDGLTDRPAVQLGGGQVPIFTAEVSASLLTEGDQERIGLTLRPVEPGLAGHWIAALHGLVNQVGALSLGELMRRAADLAERQAIDVALRRASASPTAAAKLLGIGEDELAERLKRLGTARE